MSVQDSESLVISTSPTLSFLREFELFGAVVPVGYLLSEPP